MEIETKTKILLRKELIMDTRELVVFKVVYEEKSINSASKRLFITPQGVSSIIKRLEKEFEALLFDRYYNGVEPTSYGRILYTRVDQLINELNDIKKMVLSEGLNGRYKLNVVSTLGVVYYLTVRFIKDFKETFKNVDLHLVELPDRYVKQHLIDNEAEIGFMAGPVDTSLFNARLFTRHRHCLVVNKNHPLANKNQISYKDLDGEWLALEGRDFMPYHNNMNRFENAGVTPKVLMETTEINLTHDIAQMNEGIGLSVDFPAWNDQHPETLIIPFEDMSCLWETYIVYKNSVKLSKEAIQFREFSIEWLERHKDELFHWPKNFEYLNDIYQ